MATYNGKSIDFVAKESGGICGGIYRHSITMYTEETSMYPTKIVMYSSSSTPINTPSLLWNAYELGYIDMVRNIGTYSGPNGEGVISISFSLSNNTVVNLKSSGYLDTGSYTLNSPITSVTDDVKQV